MADKSAEKERLFNEWFTASYDRLRGTLRRYGMLDEDNFHDTYLFVRRHVTITPYADLDIDSFKNAVDGIDDWFISELKAQNYNDAEALVAAFRK